MTIGLVNNYQAGNFNLDGDQFGLGNTQASPFQFNQGGSEPQLQMQQQPSSDFSWMRQPSGGGFKMPDLGSIFNTGTQQGRSNIFDAAGAGLGVLGAAMNYEDQKDVRNSYNTAVNEIRGMMPNTNGLQRKILNKLDQGFMNDSTALALADQAAEGAGRKAALAGRLPGRAEQLAYLETARAPHKWNIEQMIKLLQGQQQQSGSLANIFGNLVANQPKPSANPIIQGLANLWQGAGSIGAREGLIEGARQPRSVMFDNPEHNSSYESFKRRWGV